MQMDWEELLFAHWALPPEHLRDRIPPGLELETYEGEAYLGVVPFRMNRVRARVAPSVPGMACFPELNLRTYVRAGDRPGVWFFSLDATSWLAVRLARLGFALPYFDARMSVEADTDGVRYVHERTHRGAPPAAFRGRYRPVGEVFRAAPGSLEHFLTERYCLYAARGERLLAADVAHPPWSLQLAEAEIEVNTTAEQIGLDLPRTPPRLHFSRALSTVAWKPRRLVPGEP